VGIYLHFSMRLLSVFGCSAEHEVRDFIALSSSTAIFSLISQDMHDAKQQLSDGIPCSDYQRLGKWSQYYVQWVFDNHTVHHEMGGSVNFNVVCPGPDLILGTYYQRSDNVKL